MTSKLGHKEIALSKLRPDEPLACDIFLKINEKMIRYLYQDDALSSEKFDFFISKNLASIYIEDSKAEEFESWINEKKEQAISEMVEEVGEEHRELVEQREETRERVYEVFADEDLDEQKVEILQNEVKSIVNKVTELPGSKSVLAKLVKHDKSMANHSINVGNIATYLALSLGFSHEDVLENIFMGALMHDYGKAKIPSYLLEQKNSIAYKQALNKHPSDGVRLATAAQKMHKQVLTIIAQHHEQWDGKGYPKALKGDEIYKPAQIVSIANVFDNALQENSRKPRDMHKVAIKIIEYDKGRNFNPELIPRVVEALKIAYHKELNPEF